MIANVAAAGIQPAQITKVIVSHFHPDHVFGLMSKAPHTAIDRSHRWPFSMHYFRSTNIMPFDHHRCQQPTGKRADSSPLPRDARGMGEAPAREARVATRPPVVSLQKAPFCMALELPGRFFRPGIPSPLHRLPFERA